MLKASSTGSHFPWSSSIIFQKLQETLTEFDGKNKDVQESLRKLEGTKKEKDSKAALESLDGDLKGALENLKQVIRRTDKALFF